MLAPYRGRPDPPASDTACLSRPPIDRTAAKGGEGGGGGGGEPSWGEVLGSRAARIGVALFVFQQFSGINAIVYFSSSGGGWGLLGC